MSVIYIKYRILPTKVQETVLNQTLALCGEVYNSLVNERAARYDIAKESLSRNTQNNHLTQWKARFSELNSAGE